MKKFVLSMALLLICIGARAQFDAGTKYVSASATGLDLSYSSKEDWRFGLEASGGLFIADKVLFKVNAGYNHTKDLDDFLAGAGLRYYFRENGIFLGAGAEFDHYTKSHNDVMIPIEVGYCFYLNHYIAIEPAVYYKMSLDDFSDKSTVGLKIGLGLFF